ncbi:MAG: aldehyde reductase [Deltaproteobacteria bacterium]|nr:aldehyde reductase [Deltaproteobacteria bacterium]
MSTVLVTGGSGFVGSHIILQLLKADHVVRTTVRSLSREADVRAMLTNAGAANRLSFFAANLERDDGWDDAVSGCDLVMHVASPIPVAAPKTEDELIVPARDGALRVLRAARNAGVKRVVFTSTCGAIYYGHPAQTEPFDETCWTDIGGEVSAYVRSKAIAERALWDFMATEGGTMELAVINPSGIFGPVLGRDFSSSIEIIKRLMNGMPGCPMIYFGVVDVRDVADLHLRAMTNPAAKGERFIAVTGKAMWMFDIATVLRARLGSAARNVPTRRLPNWLVRIAARFDPSMRQLLPLLGVVRNATSAKAERLLGWKPRPREDAIIANAESLIKFGIVKVAP